jgi:hypothetical protein
MKPVARRSKVPIELLGGFSQKKGVGGWVPTLCIPLLGYSFIAKALFYYIGFQCHTRKSKLRYPHTRNLENKVNPAVLFSTRSSMT